MDDAPDMAPYVSIETVSFMEQPIGHNVFLTVGDQKFCVTRYAGLRPEAEFMARMLRTALRKIVAEAVAK
jgi:hypothetical protein